MYKSRYFCKGENFKISFGHKDVMWGYNFHNLD